MGRVKKIGCNAGITYFPFHVGTLDSLEIKMLRQAKGDTAVLTWLKLTQLIYSEYGYYMDVKDEKRLFIIAYDKCHLTVDELKLIITTCVGLDLFDKTIYDKHKVLTNAGIQETYLTATNNRRKNGGFIEIIDEYSLIDFNSANSVRIVNLAKEVIKEIGAKKEKTKDELPTEIKKIRGDYTPMDKLEPTFKPPEIEEVIKKVKFYFPQYSDAETFAKQFHSYYESNNWKTSGVIPRTIYNWEQTLQQWHSRLPKKETKKSEGYGSVNNYEKDDYQSNNIRTI